MLNIAEIIYLALLGSLCITCAFQPVKVTKQITYCHEGAIHHHSSPSTLRLRPISSQQEYKNIFTAIAGKFLPSSSSSSEPRGSSYLDSIDWKAKKRVGLSRSAMIKALKTTLPKKQWFVTGLVEPSLFSDNFTFQDPDVKLKGCENYSRGVARLFASDCAASIINIVGSDDDENKITITWRLSGSVKLGLFCHI